MSDGIQRALSISCQVSDRTICNRRCKYCIAGLTPGNKTRIPEDELRFCSMKRWRVGLQFAERLRATHAILTGKAEPTQEDAGYLCKLVREARKRVPCVDMHTNFVLLQKGKKQAGLLGDLDEAGLTMLTLSLASFDHKVNKEIMGGDQDVDWLIEEALLLELQVRCSLVVNKQGAADNDGVLDYIMEAGRRGAHSVVVREVWIPDTYGKSNEKVFAWNKANFVAINPLEDGFQAAAKLRDINVRRLPDLPWGTKVFGVGGGMLGSAHEVNVTFAICDQPTVGGVLKSIVHTPEGHGYPSWDGRGGILY